VIGNETNGFPSNETAQQRRLRKPFPREEVGTAESPVDLFGNDQAQLRRPEVSESGGADPRRLVWASLVSSEVLVRDLAKLDILTLWAADPESSPLLAELRGAFAEKGVGSLTSITVSSKPEVVTVTISVVPTTTTPQPAEVYLWYEDTLILASLSFAAFIVLAICIMTAWKFGMGEKVGRGLDKAEMWAERTEQYALQMEMKALPYYEKSEELVVTAGQKTAVVAKNAYLKGRGRGDEVAPLAIEDKERALALEDAPAEPASPPLSPKARLKRNVMNAGRNGVSLIRTGLRYPLDKVRTGTGNIREWGREKLKNRRNNKRYEPQPEEPQGGLQRAPAEPPAEPQGTAPPKESA
jgi:hypothetical protein